MSEFVMVPREWVETAVAAGAGEVLVLSDIATLAECLSQQHQGEPVGYARTGNLRNLRLAAHCGSIEMTGVPRGVDYVPLYTHTDPGEVERLRAENEAFDAGMRNLACQLSAGGYNANSLTADQLLEKVQWGLTHLTEAHARLVDSLRAQLADQEKLHGGELGLPKEGWPEYHKRKMETLRNLTAGYYERKLAKLDALLRELADAPPAAMEFRLQQMVKAALSASAEPSAPKCKSCGQVPDGQGGEYPCKDCGLPTVHDEPSAPVEIDERAAFEAWAKEQGLSVSRTPQALCFYNGMRRATGDYIDLSSLCSYAAWQARAALERKP